MSPHSRGPVLSNERLARFVFDPIHVRKKTGDLMPSVFSQVSTSGCSVQRDTVAGGDEINGFVRKFMLGDQKRVWVGVLLASCESVRKIVADNGGARAVCVYDTAERENPAHAELFNAYDIPEADEPELRRQLFGAFGEGKLVNPQDYRNGAVWGSLSSELRDRKPTKR